MPNDAERDPADRQRRYLAMLSTSVDIEALESEEMWR
jgi:hypothetical protein